MDSKSHNTIDTSTQVSQTFTETGKQQAVEEGFGSWNTLSNVANIIEVVGFCLTFWTLVTVRKYKSEKLNSAIIEKNLSELKKLLSTLTKYQRYPKEISIPGDVLDRIKIHGSKLRRYGRTWNKFKYRSEFKTIDKTNEINDTTITNLVNDLDTIIKVVEYD